MWEWTLNWDQIREDLIIGSCPVRLSDIDMIHRGAGATAILSLQNAECWARFAIDYGSHQARGRQLGLEMVNAPMRDFDPRDQRLRLPTAVRALADLLSKGHRVYVHCTAGINRAPLAVTAYLSFVERQSPDEAIALIRRSRPQAAPYWEAFHGCREDLVSRFRDAIRDRALRLSETRAERKPEADWREAEKEILRERLLERPSEIESG